jgi:drug/metabolite transporter (DMT)-like permease
MMPRLQDHRLAGIGLMLLGIFVFALNDALGKWLVATYSVGQLLLVRSMAALALLLPFLWRDRGCKHCGRSSPPSKLPVSTGRWRRCRSRT